MTVARFVPWGIQPEEGLLVIALSRYLGMDRDVLGKLLRRLGIRTWHEPATHEARRRSPSGKRLLVSEEDAARLIVRIRARDGRRLLKASDASHAHPGEPLAQAAPPPESTAE